jgi:hypothetical protein
VRGADEPLEVVVDLPRPSRQLAARTIAIALGGCLSLVVLGVLFASGTVRGSAILLPAGIFAILLTLVELLLARRV